MAILTKELCILSYWVESWLTGGDGMGTLVDIVGVYSGGGSDGMLSGTTDGVLVGWAGE